MTRRTALRDFLLAVVDEDDHLGEEGLGYKDHAERALRISALALVLCIKLIIHALIPSYFSTATNDFFFGHRKLVGRFKASAPSYEYAHCKEDEDIHKCDTLK